MNIKKVALTSVFFSLALVAGAQQKLSDGADNGLTVNQNAILELASKNKGLLHTRVTLEATTRAYPMSAHVVGLMVYNTETRNDVVPGIYYNDGSKWVLASGGKATSISYNPTTFEISFVDASGNPVTIDFKEVVKKNETITTLVSLGEGKYEYNSENGTKTLINVPDAVIQNFETIVKDENVKNEIINLIKNIGGNVYYDGTKFTYITPQGEVKEITIKEIVQANETETTLTKNANGTYTYKNEKGIEVIIDIPASVVENFETIVNKGPVTINGNTFETIEEYIQHIASSSVAVGGSDFVTVSGKGTTADPYKVEIKGGSASTMLVTNAAGELQWATIESIVKGNETVTTLVALGEGQYEYTAEDGKKTVINVPSDVIQNFETIVKEENVKNEIINLIKNVGGNVYYDGDKFTYITTTGETKEITIKEIVQANETLTVLSYDQTTNALTYKDEKGKEEVINLNIGTIVYDSKTNTITYVDGNGLPTPLTLNETSLVYDQTTKVLTYTDSKGVPHEIDLGALVAAHETETTLEKTSNGTYTYTNEKNKTTIIDIPAEVINNFEQIVKGEVKVDGRTFNTVEEYITYLTESKGGFTKIVYDQTTGDVIFQEWNETKQEWVNVDNSKFDTIVKGNETVTVLVKNSDGTYTYYNEKQIGADGNPKAGETGVTIDPKEVSVALNATTNKYEFKNSAGTVIGEIDANAGAIAFDNSTNGFQSKNVQSALEELKNSITDVAGTKGNLTLDGGLEFASGTDGVAKLLANAGIQIKDGGVTTAKLASKAVTSEKLDGGQGEDGRVGVADKDGNIVYKTLDEVVKAKETVTVLVKNSDGTYTYYNEKQIGADGNPKAGETGVTIDPKEVSVALNTTTNKYEFKNSAGTVIGEIDANAGAIAFDNSTNGFQSKNVQSALEELKNSITDVAGTKGNLTLDGGLEFASGTDGVAKLLANAGIQIKDGGVTTAKLASKAVTSEKLDGGQGEDGRVGVADKDGNIVYKTLDEVVKANETVTNLVENTNGTFTYYNEEAYAADGTLKPGATGVNIDPSLVNVTKEGNKYVFKDNGGNTIAEITYNAGDVVYNDNTTKLGATNVQEAIEKLLTKITAVEGTKGELTVAGGIEFATGDGKDKLLADAGIQIANQGVTTAKLADKNVTADKLTAGAGNDGRVAIADKDGNVTYIDAIPSTSISGKDVKAASDKVVLGGTPVGAALKEFSVDVDETKLNLEANQIKGGTKGQVIVADEHGKGQWVNQTDATTNSLVRTDNSINSTVNGKESETTIIGKVENTLSGTELTTAVNGIEGKINLKDAIQAGQKETVVKEGAGTKVVTNVDADGKVTTYTVSADPATIALDGDVTGNAGATTISKIQGKELVAQNPAEGNVLVFEDGKWVTKTPAVNTDNVTNGKKLTGTGITVTGGEAALLKEANVAITPGGAGQVMVTTTDGKATEWKNLSDITSETTNALGLAGNKLTSTVNGKEASVILTDANLTSTKKITSSNITVTGGEGATLTDVTLEVTAGANGQVMVTKDGKTTWVNQSDIVPATTNELSSTGNKMTSNVNGVSKVADIVNEVKNEISGTTLTTSVNGIPAEGVDLKGAIQAGQKTAEVVKGVNTTVTTTPDGNNTTYAVNVSDEAIQTAQKTTSVTKGSDKVTVVTTGAGTTANNTEYTVDVDEAKLSLQNIGGKVTNNQITTGTKEGQVLITKGTTTEWVDQSTIVPATINKLELTGNDLVSTVNGVASSPAVDLSKYMDNTDSQILKDFKVIGSDLSITIEGGNTIKVPLEEIAKVVDTDKQQISSLTLDGNMLKIALERGGEKEVNLSTLKTITYMKNGTNTTVTGDGTSGKEFQVHVSKEAIQAAQKTTVVAAGDGVIVAPPVVAGDVTTYTVSVKELKAAMPKFFYMPSIIIPTHNSQVAAPAVFGTIDLYALYQKQFGTPMRSNSNKSTTLPVLPKNELDYYITWFDESVFETVNVNGDGVMTYTVKSGADISVGSFMNIVFAVRL